MRIKTFGAKHFTGQLPRIEEGFKELGHDIVEENPDLIYCNNPWFDDALKEKCPIKIFNVLDVPEHLAPNYNLEKLEQQLAQATHITCISRTTKEQLKHFFHFHDAEIAIIYNPVMPVCPVNYCPDLGDYKYKYLIVGRAADPNKRNLLAYQYLKQYDPSATVAVVGSEPISFGHWFGVLPSDILNQFYNNVDYVFSLTKYGGIELPAIEAVLAGTFPIVCNDCKCAMEFNPEFGCVPTAEGIHKKVLEIQENTLKYKETLAQKQPRLQKMFDKVEVAKRILELV